MNKPPGHINLLRLNGVDTDRWITEEEAKLEFPSEEVFISPSHTICPDCFTPFEVDNALQENS
ncbi:MAG TPA: hypothetical protein V6C65_07625 [Allocoleopsis sp.]